MPAPVSIQAGYDALHFSRVVRELQQFLTTELSAFYCDSNKDVLYSDAPHSRSRRAAQTVLAAALETVTLAVAPIAVFTAEDILSFYPPALRLGSAQGNKGGDQASEQKERSVFTCGWLPASCTEIGRRDTQSRSSFRPKRNENSALRQDR